MCTTLISNVGNVILMCCLAPEMYLVYVMLRLNFKPLHGVVTIQFEKINMGAEADVHEFNFLYQ